VASLAKEDKARIEKDHQERRANWTPQDDEKYGTLKEAMDGMITEAERKMIDRYRAAGVPEERLKGFFEIA